MKNLKNRIKAFSTRFVIRVLSLLTKIGVIAEYTNFSTSISGDHKITRVPNIDNDRMEFEVSYTKYKVSRNTKWWFETLGGKKLYEIYDKSNEDIVFDFRANLIFFVCKFSPDEIYAAFSDGRNYDYIVRNRKIVKVDFSDFRYAFKFVIPTEVAKTISEEEIKSLAIESITSKLFDKVVEINEQITHIKNDGELTSDSGNPLSDNLLCKNCGLPVFATNKPYVYECINCGEISKVKYVDPIYYAKVMRNTLSQFKNRRGE